MATARKIPDKFDLAKFEQMVPPIRIRIERRNNKTGQMEPIPLPQDVWSKEDAQNIEQIVLNDIAGGGSYKGAMVDSAGATMEWSFAYPIEYFPQLIPPGSAGALGHAPAPPPPPAIGGMPGAGRAPMGYHQMGTYGTPLTPPAPMGAPPYQVMGGQSMINPWAQGAMWPPMPGTPGYTPYGYQAPPAPAPVSTPRSESKAELEAMRQQLTEVRRQADEERHAREREQQQAQFREQIAQQERQHSEEMRSLREMLQQNTRRGDDDPMIIQMKQQNEMLKQQLDEQRRQAEERERRFEADQAAQRHREELRTLQDSTEKQIEALKDIATNKEDPQMRMLLEMQRTQMENQREQTRTQADLAKESTRQSAEQPRMIVEMMERLRAASGSEQILAQLNQSYAALMEQQRGITEMVMNMGQSPGMALAEGALNSGKEVLERFISAKQAEETSKHRAAQAQAQAQAQAVAAQQQMYQQQMYAQAQQPVYRDENGAIKGQPPQRQQLGSVMPIDVPSQASVTPGESDVRTEIETEPSQPGAPSEADIFGPLAPQVQQLREAVQGGDAGAEDVANVILQAANVISENDLEVPVFSLFAEQRFPDLIEILLPGAGSEFIAEVMQHLGALIEKHGVTLEEDDDEYEDDDEDEGPPDAAQGGNSQPVVPA